jgi:hypothetical protein
MITIEVRAGDVTVRTVGDNGNKAEEQAVVALLTPHALGQHLIPLLDELRDQLEDQRGTQQSHI